MKKLFVWAFLLGLFYAAPVFADGSITTTIQNVTKDASIRTVTFAWAADSSGNVPLYSTDIISVPSNFGSAGTLTGAMKGYYILTAETKPGSTAPTAYSVTLKDSLGLDRLGGLLASLSTSTTQMFNIGLASWGYTPVNGPLLLNITGNNTASATGTLVLTLFYAGNTVPAQP